MSTILLDVSRDVNSYKGIFGWEAFQQPLHNRVRPAIEIELFLKQHSVPTRKRKFTEVNTIDMIETTSGNDVSFHGILEGSPSLLQVTMTGWVKTPLQPNVSLTGNPNIFDPVAGHGLFEPRDKDGNVLLDCIGMSYAEIVSMYLMGTMNQTEGNALQRKDPDYFISPYGHRYESPIISVWEIGAMVGFPKKQSITATVLLEK